MKQNLDFKRGELAATARALLNLYTMEEVHPIHIETMEHELNRLIDNMFQTHGQTGYHITALTILAMVGEEHNIAPVTR